MASTTRGFASWAARRSSSAGRTTHKRDRVDKRAVLVRARVPHYWLVDPEEKLLELFRWTPTGYEVALTASSGDVIRAEPFDAVELRAAVLFGDEDDEE